MDRNSNKSDTGSCGYRKNPQAPRRFKSPYILFSISKMQEFKHLCKNTKVTNFSSQVSKEWKVLSENEREKWKLMAEKDKLRYEAEKKSYTGPWKIRSDSSRKKRPKDAPKRPPSAFLNYCQRRRSELQRENPGMKNTEISKLLGEEWKNAPSHVRQPHIDKEKLEREEYHHKVAIWRQMRKGKEAQCQYGEGLVNRNTVDEGQFETMSVSLPSGTSTLYPSMNKTAFQLSPRELLPIPPKEPEKVSPRVSHKTYLGLEQVSISSASGWEDGSSMQYDYIDESTIPTILPATEPPASSSQSPFKTGMRRFADTDGVEARPEFAPPSLAFPLPSDGLDDQHHLVFPDIFQGDTAFDPPIS